MDGTAASTVRGARPSAVAGLFYPARADDLRRTVDRLLAVAAPPSLGGEVRALVAPHAGYDFSGAVAASAYVTLPEQAVRVALLGPSHFVPLAGAAVSGAEAWRTPLGAVPVDEELRECAVRAGAVVDDRQHVHDHAVEVQLPFLQQRTNGDLAVLPVAVGRGAVRDVAALVDALAPAALVVVSTDLSHYHEVTAARRLDRRTAEAIVALDDRAIGDIDACGAHALRGLLVHAREAGWTCTLLDLRTSADMGGPPDGVVGYGAFAFTAGPRTQVR